MKWLPDGGNNVSVELTRGGDKALEGVGVRGGGIPLGAVLVVGRLGLWRGVTLVPSTNGMTGLTLGAAFAICRLIASLSDGGQGNWSKVGTGTFWNAISSPPVTSVALDTQPHLKIRNATALLKSKTWNFKTLKITATDLMSYFPYSRYFKENWLLMRSL